MLFNIENMVNIVKGDIIDIILNYYLELCDTNTQIDLLILINTFFKNNYQLTNDFINRNKYILDEYSVSMMDKKQNICKISLWYFVINYKIEHYHNKNCNMITMLKNSVDMAINFTIPSYDVIKTLPSFLNRQRLDY